MTASTPTITLTADQQKGADAFFKFLTSDKNIFVLSGGAGVGKTFMMKYLQDTMLQTYKLSCGLLGIKPVNYQVHYTATTNKAAEVLEHAVNQDVSTVHSFLGLRVQDDFKTGKSYITETYNSSTWDSIILFIDESSMIDQALLDQIMKRVTNSKIVFVGDHAQLAPVGETLSPVYRNVDEDNFVHLTQAVRNANSPELMKLCDQLRYSVQNNQFFPIGSAQGAIEFLEDAQMQSKLEEHFREPTDKSRILCYTNSRVSEYNEFIREMRGLPPEFIIGDSAIVARTFQMGKLTLNVEREVLIENINPQVESAGFQDVTPDGKEIHYRTMTIRPKAKYMDSYEIPVPINQTQVQQAMKKLARKKDWGRYFRLKNEYLDIRGKEACTVYKSQGSTYDTVFIDLGNIGTSFDADQVARMLFVAVSRATTKVYFYGNLPGIYNGAKPYDHSLAAE